MQSLLKLTPLFFVVAEWGNFLRPVFIAGSHSEDLSLSSLETRCMSRVSLTYYDSLVSPKSG